MPTNPMELLQVLILVLSLIFNVQNLPAWLKPPADLPFWPELPIDMPALPGGETAEWWTVQTLLSARSGTAQTCAEADVAAAQRAQARKSLALAAPDAAWQPDLAVAALPSATGLDAPAALAGLQAAEGLDPGGLSSLPAGGYGRRSRLVGATRGDPVQTQTVELARRPDRAPLGLGLLGLGMLAGLGYLWRGWLVAAMARVRAIRR